MAGLLLVGHGDNAGGGTAARLARELLPFVSEVAVAFMRGGPSPEAALAGMFSSEVDVLPVLASGGRLYQELRARLVGRFLGKFHQPLGCSPALREMAVSTVYEFMLSRHLLREDTALIVLAHGSLRDLGADAAAKELAKSLSELSSESISIYISQSPSAILWPNACKSSQIIFVPLFFSHGSHQADLLALSQIGANGRRLFWMQSLGESQKLSMVVMKELGLDNHFA